jgi:hypothetical protein
MAATTTVTLNGRTIDLSRVLPLTLGDWRGLKKLGVTPQLLSRLDKDTDADVIAAYAFYLLHKADPTVTPDEVDALTFEQLGPILLAIGAASQQDGDRPFSAPSTPSPPPTGGASGTSSS